MLKKKWLSLTRRAEWRRCAVRDAARGEADDGARGVDLHVPCGETRTLDLELETLLELFGAQLVAPSCLANATERLNAQATWHRSHINLSAGPRIGLLQCVAESRLSLWVSDSGRRVRTERLCPTACSRLPRRAAPTRCGSRCAQSADNLLGEPDSTLGIACII